MWSSTVNGVILLIFVLCFVHLHANADDFLLNRPAVYGGMQTKSQEPLYFGVMWHNYYNERGSFIKLREVCDYDDSVNYKVHSADGVSFSDATVVDTHYMDVSLRLSVVKTPQNGSSFLYRIEGTSNDPTSQSELAVFVYVSLDPSASGNVHIDGASGDGLAEILGENDDVGAFRLRSIAEMSDISEGDELSRTRWYANRTETPWKLAPDIAALLGDRLNHNQSLPNWQAPRSNMAVIQKILTTPFEWTVAFESRDHPIPLNASANFTEMLEEAQFQFQERVDRIFNFSSFHVGETASSSSLLHQSSTVQDQAFGTEVLSHLLNGLSYFSGDRYVNDLQNGTIYVLHNASLLSFIPSKFGFPRPFFWDEGFHELVNLRWNVPLFQRVIASWLQLQSSTGWIAREQIIGQEAQERAPPWAWPGLTTQMNPPILFYSIVQHVQLHPTEAVKWLLQSEKETTEKVGEEESSVTLWSRLQRTYHWYLTQMQSKAAPQTFVWQGRSGDGALDSGLDDFPRFPHPSPLEANVDAQAWMAAVAQWMTILAGAVNDSVREEQYAQDAQEIALLLSKYFWSMEQGFYVDIRRKEETDSGAMEYGHHVGFPGMLPLCLSVERDPERIDSMLTRMLDEKDLLDPRSGLLSLSQKDAAYRQSGNYWRGNIWANVQYLCAAAMYHTYEKDYPKAGQLRREIESRFIQVAMENYGRDDGGIFETYHPVTGIGYNNLPFTGWTTLVSLMMSQQY